MRFMPSMSNFNIAEETSPVKEKEFKTQLAHYASMCEVMQGVFLIIELILPTRNLSMVFMWWQYLQMRYMQDKEGHIKKVFSLLDKKISTIIQHKLCPKIVIKGYDLLKRFLADKVKPPQRSDNSAMPSMSSMFSNLKSKCSVM